MTPSSPESPAAPAVASATSESKDAAVLNVTVLLLSGGLDSAALAHWHRPDYLLFVDYGQRPRAAEHRAARGVARELGLPFADVEVDLRPLGGGLLAHEETDPAWPSPEWWPYRNQFLITVAGAWAIKHVPNAATTTETHIITATVAPDGERHRDGTSEFYSLANSLLAYQEGHVTVGAPALHLTTEALVQSSDVPDEVIGWTHSCHRADIPCGDCPGCHKRTQVLAELNRLQ